jgi:hypothetical protein
MIQKCNLLHNDNKTREELLNHIKICKTSYKDAYQILNILMKAFNIPSDAEALRQLLYTNANLDESVKVIDERDGKIYGLLILCDHPIQKGSPIFGQSYDLSMYLNKYSQLHGFAFVIDERIRGERLHRDILQYNMAYISQFDFIWCAVENELKSHNYWKRLGFEEVLCNRDAKFYIKFFDKKRMLEIFMIKMFTENANYY